MEGGGYPERSIIIKLFITMKFAQHHFELRYLSLFIWFQYTAGPHAMTRQANSEKGGVVRGFEAKPAANPPRIANSVDSGRKEYPKSSGFSPNRRLRIQKGQRGSR